VIDAAPAPAAFDAAATADARNELTRVLLDLMTAPSFSVRRIGPEAASTFRALEETRSNGGRWMLFGDAQIRIEVKLNGQAVLARIN